MKGEIILITTFVIFSMTFDLLIAQSCTYAKTGQPGECKHIWKCQKAREDFRLLRQQPQVCDLRTHTVCCPSDVRISAKKCKEYSEKYRFETEIVQNPMIGEPPIKEKVPKCNHDVVPLIVGGVEAKLKEFPHMALIGFGLGMEEDYGCGGSLISEQWILSAAHCSNSGGDPANFAKLGHVVRNTFTPNSQTYKIVKRLVHPDYNSRYGDDDIALFKLETAATLNDFVIPICLPDIKTFRTRSAIAIGYGNTNFHEGLSDKLMKVVINYMDNYHCNEVFKDNSKFAKNIFDSDKMICAGNTNKTGDSCNGDSGKIVVVLDLMTEEKFFKKMISKNDTSLNYTKSGGPLQIYHEEEIVNCMYQITGITSFGSSYCGIPGVPAVYTKVYHYLDWIEKNVWPGE